MSVKHFAKEKPFIFTRGNHETRGPNARNLMSYFPHKSGKFYCSFTHGNVYFIVLDSGEDKPDSHPVYAGLVDFDNYRDEQAKWLQKEVSKDIFKDALYKIVLIHMPVFSGSKRHGAGEITAKWGSILNEANIDLLISGHHHRYSKIEKTDGKNRFPIIILGQDMIIKTDVSDKQVVLKIKNIKGEDVDRITIPVKHK